MATQRIIQGTDQQAIGRDEQVNQLADTAHKIEAEIRSRHMEAQALLNAPPAPRADVVKDTGKDAGKELSAKEPTAPTPTSKGVKAAKAAEA